MAADIAARFSHSEPVLVCVMNGGIVPFGKLLPRLPFPLVVDYVHATRYADGLCGGELQWVAQAKIPPQGRNVVLVDDILDEGLTLAGIEAHYRAAGAASVSCAVLVRKQRQRAANVHVEFVGLDVPDRYVFGYGMDYKGYLRNAPGIYAISERAEEK